jgi:Tfp pilus assembly PilM family ATPase
MKVTVPSFCGLDLQRDYFSIIQYSTEEQAVTLLSIQPFSAEGGINAWKTWKNELKNSKGRLRFFSPAVICGMPSEYAVIKIITLDADEAHIAEAIEWEFGQQIIGSVDEYGFDYEEIEGAPGASTRKYLVVAYRQEQINRMAGIVRSVKLEPQIIDLDIFGLVNIFLANYTDKKPEESLLVHSESELTKLVLTRNGEFRDFHCFEHQSGSIDAAGFAMALSAEIDRFLAGAEKSDGRTGIYITGSYFQQAFSRDAFFEKVPQAELLNPFRTIKCQVKIEEQQVQEYSTQLAVAAGLALRGGESK